MNKYEIVNSTTEMTKDQIKSKMTKLQYEVYQRITCS